MPAAAAFLALIFSACRPQPDAREPVAGEPAAGDSPAILLDPAAPAPPPRVLRGGEVHVLRIDLEAGHYLHLRIDQLGVDLVATLLDPEGRPLLEVDTVSGADGSAGPERLIWVAEAAGSYRVHLRAWGEAGAGRYRLAVEDLRPATELDRLRAAAELATARAVGLYEQGTPESRRQAAAGYRQTLAAFEELGERTRAADVLFRLGQVREALGENGEAMEAYRAALGIYRELGPVRQQAITAHSLGVLYNSAREIEKARAHGRQALVLWRQSDDRRGQALTANLLGVIHRRLGEFHPALVFYDQALGLWRELGDRAEEAKALHNRGRLYSLLGSKDQALADLHAALDVQREVGSPRSTALYLDSLGRATADWNEPERAADYFRQALELRETERSQAMTRAGLGRALAELGQTEEALAQYRRAKAVFHRRQDLIWEAHTLQSIGWLLAARAPEALEHFDAALALQERIRDRSGAAFTRLGMASAERHRDDLPAARRHLEAALAIVEDLRTRVSAANQQRAFYFATKQRYYEAYVDLLMEFHLRDPAAGYGEQALAASERARARSLLDTLQRTGVDREPGKAPEAVAREHELERQINARELQLLRLAQTREPAADGVRERLEGEQRELLREYAKLQGQLALAGPQTAALGRSRPLSVAEIERRVLDPQTVLLEFRLGEERSFLWAVTPEAAASFVLPGRGEIEPVARRAYELLSQDRRQAQARLVLDLAELSDVLLGPAAAQIGAAKRLLVVADGVLQYLPFGALPAPGAAAGDALPLVASREVVTAPSASLLAALRGRDRGPPAAGTLAVVADPVFGRGDARLAAPRTTSGRRRSGAARPGVTDPAAPGAYPRLVHSRREAERILALVPAADRFAALGFDASRDAIASGELSRYRIVHFATHGDLDEEHPELSRLVLSLVDRHGRARDDGLLYAYEIYDLRLAAELVVLSACQTALGREIRGEGLVGLTRGFLHAGAERVLVSLWKVDDEATAELMERFYRALLADELAPAAALRAAQDSIRRERRWRAPYYWAGFVLQGEWKDIRR